MDSDLEKGSFCQTCEIPLCSGTHCVNCIDENKIISFCRNCRHRETLTKKQAYILLKMCDVKMPEILIAQCTGWKFVFGKRCMHCVDHDRDEMTDFTLSSVGKKVVN